MEVGPSDRQAMVVLTFRAGSVGVRESTIKMACLPSDLFRPEISWIDAI